MDRRLLASLALAATAACGGSRAQPDPAAATSGPADAAAAAAPAADSTSGRDQPRRRARRDRNAITREEIQELGMPYTNLYDFVMSQHFEWVRGPGGRLASSVRPVSVYVDFTRFGNSPESMRQIPLSSVYLARKLGPSEAEAKYGLDNNSGTIEVFTSADRVR